MFKYFYDEFDVSSFVYRLSKVYSNLSIICSNLHSQFRDSFSNSRLKRRDFDLLIYIDSQVRDIA